MQQIKPVGPIKQLATRTNRLKLVTSRAEESIFDIYINGLAPSGRSGVRSLINTCANLLQPSYTAERYPWQHLNYADVSRLRAKLLDLGYSVASVNMALAALRGLAKVAFNVGKMNADELSRVQAVPRVSGESLMKGRSLSRQEIRAMLQTANTYTSKARRLRDRALLLTGCGAGLRAAELVSLTAEDYERELGRLTVKNGKGRKPRSIYVAKPICSALERWLDYRGCNAGALFTRISRAGAVAQDAITKPGLSSILNELAMKAGVSRFTPHDLRRTFITHLLDAGADINTVRQLAGHSNISTTARYDYRGELTKMKTARAFCCW